MARQRPEVNATRQTRRSRTRSVASTAPPPSGARLTRGLGEVLTQPCDNTHSEASPPIAAREPRQCRQTSFFTVGAAPPPRTHAVSRRPAAKKQTAERRPSSSGPEVSPDVRAFLLSRGLEPEQAGALLSTFAGADAATAAVVAAAAAVTNPTVAAPAAAAPAAPSADAPAKKFKAAFDTEPSWLTLPAPTPFQADLEADAPPLPGWPLASWEDEHPMPNLGEDMGEDMGEDVLVKAAVAAPEQAAGSECSPAADPAAQQPLDFSTGFWQVCACEHHGLHGDRRLPAPRPTLSVAPHHPHSNRAKASAFAKLHIAHRLHPLTSPYIQAGTAGVELLPLSPARGCGDGCESPHNLVFVSDPHSSNLAKFMPAQLMTNAPSASRANPMQAQLCGTPGCGLAAYHEGLCLNQQVVRPRQRRPSLRVLTEAAEGSPPCRVPAASKKRAAPTSASRASPTFVGHNFMDEPSRSPFGFVPGSGPLRVQAGAAEAEAKAEAEAAAAAAAAAAKSQSSQYRGVGMPPQPAPQAQSGIASYPRVGKGWRADVVVPDGVKAGQQVKFARPAGGWFMVTVPPGVSAGQRFRVELTKELTRTPAPTPPVVPPQEAVAPGLHEDFFKKAVREDCGKCRNCLDKRRFGGPGVRRQVCEQRESPLVKAAKAAQAKAAFCTLSAALQGGESSE